MIVIKVDFPAPFGPIKAILSLGPILKETSEKRVLLPKLFAILFNEINRLLHILDILPLTF